MSPGSVTTAGERTEQVNPDDGLAFARRTCAVAADATDIFAGDRLRFEPGTAFRYSSYGWVLVSALVEAVAGEPFADFMEQARGLRAGRDARHAGSTRRAGPWAATGTRLPGPGRPLLPGVRHAHAARPARRAEHRPHLSHGRRRLRVHAERPGAFRRGAVARRRARGPAPSSSCRRRRSSHRASRPTTGLGWFVRRVPLDDTEVRVVGHGGSAVGGSTSFMAFPDHDLVIAVSSNVSFAEDTVRSLALADGGRVRRPRMSAMRRA